MNKLYLKINNKDELLIKKATWFWPRFIGLMGKKNINYGILFPKTNSIHTFFMKEKIDVIAINPNNEIIMIHKNVSKNKIIKIKNKYKKTSIIELPYNTSNNFEIGQKLIFISK